MFLLFAELHGTDRGVPMSRNKNGVGHSNIKSTYYSREDMYVKVKSIPTRAGLIPFGVHHPDKACVACPECNIPELSTTRRDVEACGTHYWHLLATLFGPTHANQAGVCSFKLEEDRDTIGIFSLGSGACSDQRADSLPKFAFFWR